MGRTGQSQDESASAAASNAQAAAINSSLAQTAKFNTDANTLKSGNNIGVNPFATPAYLQNENTSAATAAGSTADAAKASIADNALRTGDNSASSLYAIKNNQRTAQQNANTALLGQHSQDYLNNLNYQQGLLGNDIGTVGATNNLYGTATSGESAANNSLTQLGLASYGPATSLIGALGAAGGAVGAAYCPAKGTMYLMADGSEKPVETLQVGDQIMGIDDEPQTIEEIQSGLADILLTSTEDGNLIRTSPTHAFALPRGGFVVAARALGKIIATDGGQSRVERSHLLLSKAYVFNVITDGSHTYRADGLWSLGVGDAERQVGMNEWAAIGRKLTEARTLRSQGNLPPSHLLTETQHSVGGACR